MEKKYNAVVKSKQFSDDNLGEWLRNKGIKTNHLEKWNEEILAMTKIKDNNEDLKIAKKRIKELERELAKKKALVEAAALLLLKKKSGNFVAGRGRKIMTETKREVVTLIKDAHKAGAPIKKA